MSRSWWRSLFRRNKQTTIRRQPRARLGFQQSRLEDRLAPAALTDGGTSTLTINLNNANEVLGIVSNGGTYAFTSTNNFTNGGVANAADFSAFGATNLTLQVSGLATYSAISIVDSATGASVNFNNSAANAYSDNFSITLDDAAAGAISFSGTSSFGASSLSASTSRNITVGGTSLNFTSGNLNLTANKQVTPTAGNFAGIVVTSKISSTGAGNISLVGRGGDDAATPFHIGVTVRSGGQVIASSTGSISMDGLGGTGSNSNYGVEVSSASTVSASSGKIQVNGSGGAGAAGFNSGITILSGSKVESLATGAGAQPVTLVGIAGTGVIANYGVAIQDAGSTLAAVDGAISVTGTGGGAGTFNEGVLVGTGGKIAGTGKATVSLTGTGGSGTASNFGVSVEAAGSTVSAVNGDVSITGTGGAGSGSTAVQITSGANVAVTGTGNIFLIGDSLEISSTVGAGTSIVTLKPVTAGIDLGGANGAGTLGLSNSDLGNITASLLRIGDATSSNIVVSGAVTVPISTMALELVTTGSVTGGAGGSITATGLAIRARFGISGVTGLSTSVSKLAFRNLLGGDVSITNTGAVSMTTVGSLDGTAGNEIGNFGTGKTTFTAKSPLTFAVNTVTAGDATYTATEAVGAGDDITVNAGITVESTGGNLTLLAGDNIVLNNTSTVKASTAGKTITLTAASGDLDAAGAIVVAAAAVTNVEATNLRAECKDRHRRKRRSDNQG